MSTRARSCWSADRLTQDVTSDRTKISQLGDRRPGPFKGTFEEPPRWSCVAPPPMAARTRFSPRGHSALFSPIRASYTDQRVQSPVPSVV